MCYQYDSVILPWGGRIYDMLRALNGTENFVSDVMSNNNARALFLYFRRDILWDLG